VLSGTVSGGGKPVMMAEVRVLGGEENTRTDVFGKYSFAGLETGNRSVEVLAQGFKSLVQPVNLGPAGTGQTLDFALAQA
jgi:hypothetical protein